MATKVFHVLLKPCLLFGFLSLSGCAFTDQPIDIKYNPAANISVIQGAETVPVDVDARDGRVANKDRVGSKKNGYGIETARITSREDVTALFHDAVEHELNSFGFHSGPGGLRAVVEVDTFYNDFKTGFFSADAVAEAAFNLTLYAPDGTLMYGHAYKAVGMNKNIGLMMGEEARPALEQALSNVMQTMANDPGLLAALQAAVARANAAPATGGKHTS